MLVFLAALLVLFLVVALDSPGFFLLFLIVLLVALVHG